eukprot:TRINITY_DN18620_c0_g1_i1.p1 TRINITY_DN18620_c0_g1~~TRINITY_DN18620_c0_g1_i1.p1  ORF type:complete len:407 (-),score=40.59 TRINITY_DN18620_c0_g1_i1:32-1252(-)
MKEGRVSLVLIAITILLVYIECTSANYNSSPQTAREDRVINSFDKFWVRPTTTQLNYTEANTVPFKLATFTSFSKLSQLCPLWMSTIINDIDLRIFSSDLNPDTKQSINKHIKYGGKAVFVRNFMETLSKDKSIPRHEKILLFVDAYDTFAQCDEKTISQLHLLQGRKDEHNVFRGILYATEDNLFPGLSRDFQKKFGKYSTPNEFFAFCNKSFQTRHINTGVIFTNPHDWYKEWLETKKDWKQDLLSTNDQLLGHAMYLRSHGRRLHFDHKKHLGVKDNFSDLSHQLYDHRSNFSRIYYNKDTYRYEAFDPLRNLTRKPCILHGNGGTKVNWKNGWIEYFESEKIRKIMKEKIKDSKGGLKINWLWDIEKATGKKVDFDEICTKSWARERAEKQKFGTIIEEYLK